MCTCTLCNGLYIIYMYIYIHVCGQYMYSVVDCLLPVYNVLCCVHVKWIIYYVDIHMCTCTYIHVLPVYNARRYVIVNKCYSVLLVLITMYLLPLVHCSNVS